MFEKHKLTRGEAKKLKIDTRFVGKELAKIPYDVIRKMNVSLEDLLLLLEQTEGKKIVGYKVISFYLKKIEEKE